MNIKRKLLSLGIVTVNDSGNVSCRDCEESIAAEDVEIYSYNIFCKDCAGEHRSICNGCSAQEKESPEYEVYSAEDNGVTVKKTLCIKCAKTLTICTNDGCRTIIVSSPYNTCTKCGRDACKRHADSHSCPKITPNKKYARSKYPGSVQKTIKIDRLVGFEIEAVNGSPEKLESSLLDNRLGTERDGSLKGGNPLEVVSPPSSLNVLEEFIDNATRALKKSKYEVNASCGLHIHVDSSDFRNSAKKIIQIISTYYALEPLLYKMLPKSRRSNMYAIPLRNWIDEIKMLEIMRHHKMSLSLLESEWYKSRNRSVIDESKGFKYDPSRYHGVNLHSLFKDGHLEIRHHNGTLNPFKIKNWISLNLTIIDWAVNNYNRDVVEALYYNDDPEAKLRIMTKRMSLPKNIRRYVVTRLTKFKDIEEDID